MVSMALVALAEKDTRPLRITRIISQNATRMMIVMSFVIMASVIRAQSVIIVEMASMERVDHVERDIQRWKKDHARMRDCSLDSLSLGYSPLDRGVKTLSREW